jgi:hypothetical protein
MTKIRRAGDADGVDELVALVRQTFTDELSPREQFGVLRVEQAWQAAHAPRRWRPTVRLRTLAVALVAAIGVPGGILAYRDAARVQFQIVNGTAAADGWIVETAADTALVFSEGSRVDVGEASRARVASTTPDGGRIVVDHGALRADIVHRPRGRWTVDAGPYSIRVTGTAFDVKWSTFDDRLDIKMTRGSVVVTGPLIRDGVTLAAGMSLTAQPRLGQLAIDDGPRQSADRRQPTPGQSAAGLEGQTPGVLHAPGPAPGERPPMPGGAARDQRARRHDRGWDRSVAEGAFPTVVAEAESAGLDHVLASASVKDLTALSDAARYTHHARTAWRSLLTLRTRFPDAPQTRDAAFFLGGLAEGDGPQGGRVAGQQALDWYNLYLRECPTGRFVGEAWGRKMILTQKQRGVQAARPLAEEYLRRFPSGPYVTAAGKLVQAPE